MNYMSHIYIKKYLELKNINQIGGTNKNDIIYQASKLIYINGKIKRKNHNSSSDTMYQIASCSKFVTSLVVAKLYELNLLDYNTDINKYLTKWKCNTKGVTLKHLLTHTSGSSDHNGFLGMEPQFPYKQNLELNIKILNGDTCSKPFNITEKVGKKFIYSGTGYQVIQQVLEEITGKRLYQLLDQYIFKPLNMNNSTGKLLYENNHNYILANMNYQYRMYAETAAAGIWMSCNDLLILLTDLINSYNNNNGVLLNQNTIKSITKSQFTKNHGLGMFIGQHKGKKLFFHNGNNHGYKMFFCCVPENNYIEICMFNYNPKYNPKYIIKEAKQLL